MLNGRPEILFPRRPVRPLRSLVLRIGLAALIVTFVALITYIGRDGYQDADGTELSLLDAFYYSTVTLTTTGFGDITPVTPFARGITAFLVTPIRVLFLILLIGTSLQLLTERYRAARAENRWRRNVNDHTIVVGYGTTGRGAIDSLLASGTTRADIIVIDASAAVLKEAEAAELVTLQGDATRTVVLNDAEIARARAVVVAPGGDDSATLVTLTARELNPSATIVAAVRETENAHLLLQSGANAVITSSESAGRLLGLATLQPEAVSVLEDIIEAGSGLQLAQRAPRADELGGPPSAGSREVPIAVVRDGVRLPLDGTTGGGLVAGDVVVVIQDR